MGGNGSFYTTKSGLITNKYTHTDTDYRIDGHKILVQTNSPQQVQIPMNSHSENSIYLCGKVDRATNELTVSSIAFYKSHRIVESIDIKVDKKGNLMPFDSKNGSHSHRWFEEDNGKMGRQAHDNTNMFPIDDKYRDFIKKIIEFNKSKKLWKTKEK